MSPTPYYSDESVTIYHGDCREILPALGGGVVDLLLSDPPYGMDYQHGARAGGRRMGMDGARIVGDKEPFDPTHLLATRCGQAVPEVVSAPQDDAGDRSRPAANRRARRHRHHRRPRTQSMGRTTRCATKEDGMNDTCNRDGCSAPLTGKRAGTVWCSRKCYIAARRALYALHGDASEPVRTLYRNIAHVRRPRDTAKRGAR